MPIELSRVLSDLAVPSNLIFIAGLIGAVVLLTGFRVLGCRLLVVSYVVLAVAGMSPLGYALMLPLEDRFPQWQSAGDAPTGIIILGGVIDSELSVARGGIAIHGSAERLTTVAELARRFPNARIVFSGGNGGSDTTTPAEADFAIKVLESFGISADRIIGEPRSRNTAENAVFTEALLKPKPNERWLLVTSAAHMPRAIGAFRRVGLPVEAYPVDWHTKGSRDLLTFSVESPFTGLSLCDSAAHEWLGLLAYWLSGRTSALFPGP